VRALALAAAALASCGGDDAGSVPDASGDPPRDDGGAECQSWALTEVPVTALFVYLGPDNSESGRCRDRGS
jgi:hypothetical protein